MALGEALTCSEGAGLMTRSVRIGMGAAGIFISNQGICFSPFPPGLTAPQQKVLAIMV